MPSFYLPTPLLSPNPEPSISGCCSTIGKNFVLARDSIGLIGPC
ncbi:hypothetical protein NC652_020567 [Populus alba x Populus x berolinensis]|nr:hypothetical protein NC652_020567 [Populus alba x Populus x berolinensis]